MSRTTGEIVADLRVGQHFLFGERIPFSLDTEAANRLTELDAKVAELWSEILALRAAA